MEEEQIVHSFEDKNENKMFTKNVIISFVIIFFLGLGTGYLIASSQGGFISNQITGVSQSGGSINKGQIFGSKDEKTFKDQAEGILKKGGIDDEGAYHLERPGGISQNVYLTSSSVDLLQFVDKKVKVWGETNTAKKAGWLMDVGRLQVLE